MALIPNAIGQATLTLSSDSWPTFHHDISRTGYTTTRAPRSPRILWTYQTGGQVRSSPVIANGTVYFSSGDGYLYALNEATGSLLWRTQIGTAAGSPAIYDGSVYAGGYYTDASPMSHAQLYRINASNGLKVWNASVGGVDLSILPVEGKVCSGQIGVAGVTVKFEGVYCLDSETGSELWTFNVTLPTELAYSGGLIYTSSGFNNGTIYALNATNGLPVWTHDTVGGVMGGPTVSGDILYAGGSLTCLGGCSKFYALKASSGSVIWSINITLAYGPPAIADGVLVMSGGSGIQGFNQTDGSRIWVFPFRGSGYSPSIPAVGGDLVIVGGGTLGDFPDPTIYALDVRTGASVWSLPVGFAADSSPAISDGVIYVGANDGKLYAIANAGAPYPSWLIFGYIALAAAGVSVAAALVLRKRRMNT